MKSTFAAVLALLAVTISAAPASIAARTTPVTISLINDKTGAHAAVTVFTDDEPNCIPDLFESSSIDVDGQILASSAQLIQFPQSVSCDIAHADGTLVKTLTPKATYVDFDNDPYVAIPQDLSDDTITCYF